MGERGQSAVEMLATYGWAILIIVIAVSVMLNLGLFGSPRALGSSCLFSGGLECRVALLNTTGNVGIDVGQATGHAIRVTSVRCTQENEVNFTDADRVSPPIYIMSGEHAVITTVAQVCYSYSGGKLGPTSGSIGSVFTGHIFVQYEETDTNVRHVAAADVTIPYERIKLPTPAPPANGQLAQCLSCEYCEPGFGTCNACQPYHCKVAPCGAASTCGTSCTTCNGMGACCSGAMQYCSGNACVQCTSANQCDDANPCTSNICDAGSCAVGNVACGLQVPGCSGASACNGVSQCLPKYDLGAACGCGGMCKSGICSGNICASCSSDNQCEDANPCTSNACLFGTCMSSNYTCGWQCGSAQVCDGKGVCGAKAADGSPCACREMCQSGTCSALSVCVSPAAPACAPGWVVGSCGCILNVSHAYTLSGDLSLTSGTCILISSSAPGSSLDCGSRAITGPGGSGTVGIAVDAAGAAIRNCTVMRAGTGISVNASNVVLTLDSVTTNTVGISFSANAPNGTVSNSNACDSASSDISCAVAQNASASTGNMCTANQCGTVTCGALCGAVTPTPIPIISCRECQYCEAGHGTPSSCEQGHCQTSGCGTPCSGGLVCNSGGQCVSPQGNNTPCSCPEMCISGICLNGVCAPAPALPACAPAGVVSQCPCALTAPFAYTLGANLSAAGSCIAFAANASSLNCRGYTITGSGLAGSSGLALTGMGNVNITNCNIRGFETGVLLSGTANTRIEYTNSTTNSFAGFSLTNGSNSNSFFGVNAGANGRGISITGATSTGNSITGSASCANLQRDISCDASQSGSGIICTTLSCSGITCNPCLLFSGTLYGYVTNATGSPLPGAVVTASGGTTACAAPVDVTGAYTCPSMAFGTYTLTATRSDYLQNVSGPLTISTAAPNLQTNFSLGAYGYFYGKVRDTLDNLLAGASVNITAGSTRLSTVTNASGAYNTSATPSAAGTYTVTASKIGFGTASTSVYTGRPSGQGTGVSFILTTPCTVMISACGYHASSAGYYCLANDVSDAVGIGCIFLDAGSQNAVFDGRGYRVTGDGSHGYGVSVQSAGTRITNATISGFSSGVYIAASASGTIVANITSSTNRRDGLRALSTGNTVTASTFNGNGWQGIAMLGSGCTLSSNTANGNHNTPEFGRYGTGSGAYLYAASGSRLNSNTFSANDGPGILLNSSTGNNLTANTASGNAFGITLANNSNSNVVSANTFSTNTGDGISVERAASNNFTGNTVRSNGGRGVSIAGYPDEFNIVANNNVCLSGGGIDIYCAVQTSRTTGDGNTCDVLGSGCSASGVRCPSHC